jgi:hypothetical protein
MADNVQVKPVPGPSSETVATKEIGGVHYPVYMETQFGVPAEYSKLTSNASTVNITKGNLNRIAFYPRILNEHVESSREVQGTVTSTNIVGQIFRASKDNISALMLTLGSAGGVVIDDFESYTNNAELQVAWVATNTLATLEQTTVFSGAKAMSLPTTVLGDQWSSTALPQDYTGYTGTFDAYFSHGVAQQQISVFIKDSAGNRRVFPITQDGPDVWCNCEVNEAAMTEDPANSLPTDITDIVTIGYEVIVKKIGGTAIIDNLGSAPPPGEIEIKLWDMGEAKPVTAVTSIDSGSQYPQIGLAEANSFTLQLQGGVRIYHMEDFYAGVKKIEPDNVPIITGNYYLLELKYLDTDVDVYGPDPSFEIDFYNSGYSFTAPDEASAISAIGQYSNIMFGIMSTQDIFFTEIRWRFDFEPNGDSSIIVFLESVEMKITDIVVDHEDSPEQEFSKDVSTRPMFLEDGGKLEFYYNDDYSDSVSKVNGEVAFLYIPPTVYG